MCIRDRGIDYIISSANKCIQGVPGFSFIICSREELKKCEGQARSLSLDLYDQWKTMEKDGKWRFTSPTHVVLAFSQALKEMEEEGGIPARHARYAENNRILIEKMEEPVSYTHLDVYKRQVEKLQIKIRGYLLKKPYEFEIKARYAGLRVSERKVADTYLSWDKDFEELSLAAVSYTHLKRPEI